MVRLLIKMKKHLKPKGKILIISLNSKKNEIPSFKLMQIKFIHAILSIGADDRDDLLTNMVFLAMKKGSRFGPFGKLY